MPSFGPRAVKTVRLIAVGLGIAIICGICVEWVGRLHVSRYYGVRAYYTVMPADDKRLENWLKVQPGVVAHTVSTERIGSELHISFIMSQTLTGSPPVPEFSHICHHLGYATVTMTPD